MSLCIYHDLLGLPGQGLHKYRIFDIAVFDTFVVICLAAFIAWYFEKPFWQVFAATILVGIIAHRLFCVRTTVDKWLFPHTLSVFLR
jgi:hypothetical protein